MGISFFLKDSLVFGWRKLREHSGLLFSGTLALLALEIAMTVVDRVLDTSVPGLLAALVLGVAGLFVGCGFTLITLRLAQGTAAAYRDLLPQGRLVWKYFCTSAITGLLVLAPAAFAFIALVAGGYYVLGDQFFMLAGQLGGRVIFAMGPSFDVFVSILASVTAVVVAYIAVRLSMTRYAIVDGCAVEESISRSFAMTREYAWKLLGFMLVLGILNMLGNAPFMVGLLVTVPISMMAAAHVYLALKKEA
jgi:hypothetical protein